MIDATLNDAFAPAPGVDDLLAAQPVPRRDGSRARILAIARRAQPDVRQCAGRRAGPAVDVRAVRADRDVARRQSPFAVRRVDDLVQPAGRRVAVAGDAARSRMRSRASACRPRCAAASRARRARSGRRSKRQPMLILTALLTLYIVLGVLYESCVHPLTILSTLPSAGVGRARRADAVPHRVLASSR